MAIFTCTIRTVHHEISIEAAPICSCGGTFTFLQHLHARKKTNQGITAKCGKCGEEYYAWIEQDMINKINRFQSKTEAT